MSLIVPLRDEVTWQQLFSWMSSWGIFFFFFLGSCYLQYSLSQASAWLQLDCKRFRSECSPSWCFCLLSQIWLIPIFLDFCESMLGFAGFVVWLCTWFLLVVKPLHCLVALPLWCDFSDLKRLLGGTENCFWSAAWWIRGHKQNGRQVLSGCVLTLYKDEMSEVPAVLCREVIWSSCFGDCQHIPTNNSRFLPFIASICSKQLNVHQAHNHLQQKASVPLLGVQKVYKMQV